MPSRQGDVERVRHPKAQPGAFDEGYGRVDVSVDQLEPTPLQTKRLAAVSVVRPSVADIALRRTRMDTAETNSLQPKSLSWHALAPSSNHEASVCQPVSRSTMAVKLLASRWTFNDRPSRVDRR